ncbi:hypothetical protein [Candidatus Chlamydia corallus]|uniref:hypothetical protein n=1 Tax=Candidatus Chlamydia corallus TaxID=2038470 RepID=UPI000C2FCE5D|nr:hypothetical protein [Candidatus Chlamydia corallus]
MLAEQVDQYFDLGCVDKTRCFRKENSIIFEKVPKKKVVSYLLVITIFIAVIFKCVLCKILYLKYRFEEADQSTDSKGNISEVRRETASCIETVKDFYQ